MNKVEELIENGDLKTIILDYMNKYGWQNVRGNPWINKDMKKTPKELTTVKKLQIKKNESNCPKCGNKLNVNEGERGTFFQCSKYPQCKFLNYQKK